MPKVLAEEADDAIDRLRYVLRKWQAEMEDPLELIWRGCG